MAPAPAKMRTGPACASPSTARVWPLKPLDQQQQQLMPPKGLLRPPQCCFGQGDGGHVAGGGCVSKLGRKAAAAWLARARCNACSRCGQCIRAISIAPVTTVCKPNAEHTLSVVCVAATCMLLQQEQCRWQPPFPLLCACTTARQVMQRHGACLHTAYVPRCCTDTTYTSTQPLPSHPEQLPPMR